jgi:hypothetical protein
MFSEKDLVARSIEDMAQEVEELQALAREEREKSEALNQKEIELRRKSVETRSVNAELAEGFWQEAESLRDECRELMRLFMEHKLRAAEDQHRIDIHDQIESLDDYDEVWRQAASARRG